MRFNNLTIAVWTVQGDTGIIIPDTVRTALTERMKRKMSKQKNNKRAGLYCRLSKDDERTGESLSIENQKRILEKYALDNGFEIIDTYIDDGYTGTNFSRPGVQRLLEDAKNGRIDVIIVKDLSRFGRNYIEVGQYTDYIFPTYNIRFIAVSDNVDSADDENRGLDMAPIMNVFNEWHSANTSKKIRQVIEANARAGKYRATYAPFGYVKGTDEKHLPVIDEPAAGYVKSIFEMRASGMSPNHIAGELNDRNVPVPSDYREQKFGIASTRNSHHLWSDTTVNQVLKNPTYLGHLVQMRSTTVSYKNKKHVTKDPDEMIWVYNTHEAIVSQELWDRCREMEASVSQGKKQKTGIVQPLSGLVFCADCGNKMYIAWNNTRHRRSDPRTYRRDNFNCGNYAKFGDKVCFSHYIQLKVLNEIVLSDIREKAGLIEIDEAGARSDFLRQAEAETADETAKDRRRLAQITKRLNELERLISSAYEDKVSGKIPEEICVNLLNGYLNEKKTLTNEKDGIGKRLDESGSRVRNVDEFIRLLKYYAAVPELTREMALRLIDFITVDRCPGKYSKEPRVIHIYYKHLNATADNTINRITTVSQ